MEFLNEDKRIWDDLTDDEKGKLLLAWHKGLQIQYWDTGDAEWNDESHIEDCTFNPFFVYGQYAFRIKPEPVKEVHWCNDYGDETSNRWWPSRVMADDGAYGNRIALIRREIVDGVVNYYREDV